MHTKRILIFATVCLVISAISMAGIFAEESVITLGGKNGWSRIQKMDGVVIGSGRYGYDCIQLDTNNRNVSDGTDLLLDFEDEPFADIAGNYNTAENNLLLSTSAKMGRGAGLSRGNGGIRLSGTRNALFGKQGLTGSFIIEFWLCPSIAENGEMVFSWRSSRTERNYPLYQMISASFYSNHLKWDFTNVFNGYKDNGGEISIMSYRTIIPNKWAHHSISFDQDTGLLEYRIDGKLEDLKYITTNGRESGGEIHSPYLGVAADIEICPSYTGRIDDFHIQHKSTSNTTKTLRYDTYKKTGGRFVTEPIQVPLSSSLIKVDAVTSEPSQTEVAIYVRSGDSYFKWNDEEPEWIPAKNHGDIEGVTGKYFQVAVDLYPDGTGAKTPSVTQIDLHYTKVAPPLPPFTVIAEAGNGQVTLSWSYSVEDEVGGYYVYYGERPGEYLGREAFQGESPVNVGNVAKVTLKGLKNGKIYYFAVATYSSRDSRIVGTLSKEVYARPLRK
ncbi:MAG: hypothetical protein IKR40_10845 [Treponema sp.]|nr:hypothetical protein [Treponema sp.]